IAATAPAHPQPICECTAQQTPTHPARPRGALHADGHRQSSYWQRKQGRTTLMARRRRSNSPPPKNFVCDDAINRMERAVIYRTVDLSSFTGHDIFDLFVPAEHMRLLRDAYSHTQNNSGIWDVHVPMAYE